MGIVAVGLMVAMIAFISSIVQAGREGTAASIAMQAAWTFGAATAALGILKTGIAVVLWGIVRRIWLRAESIKAALPKLMPPKADQPPLREGAIDTSYGPAEVTRTPPAPLFIHRLSFALWAPMLLMGVMGLGAGLILSFIEAGAASSQSTGTFNSLRALVPGIMFFGEALLLAGISFLLGSILGSIRQGGGEVQESVGVHVKTLKMPLTAKLFVALMMMGMMVEMAQLGLYIYAATLENAESLDVWLTWLGPLREAGLGLLLSGIVLALASIGKVLGFQFSRIQELIAVGR
ncbi:MAG: hypothetical protein HY330_05120 [Chloroflexi bacterium]|nr:hypothetical protein [Chloroflexota bacterium]